MKRLTQKFPKTLSQPILSPSGADTAVQDPNDSKVHAPEARDLEPLNLPPGTAVLVAQQHPQPRDGQERAQPLVLVVLEHPEADVGVGALVARARVHPRAQVCARRRAVGEGAVRLAGVG